MSAKFTIDFSSKRYQDILSKTKDLPNYVTKYGFIDGKTNPYPNSSTEVTKVALYNEFGTDKIPARPFFSNAFNENYKKYRNKLANFYRAWLRGEVNAPRHFFKMLGVDAAVDVQRSINQLMEPPNAPSTIKRKKSSKPLIDTGHMIRSVTWEVLDED